MKRSNAEIPAGAPLPPGVTQRFHLNLRPRAARPLAVVSGGMDLCAPGYELRRETATFYALEYIVSGAGWLKLAGRDHPLRPGLVFAYGPGIGRHLQVQPAEPLVKYFVDFTGSQSLQWFQHIGLAPGRTLRVYPADEIQPLFAELVRNGRRGTRQAPELCRQLLEGLGTKLGESRAPRSGADTAAFATYQRCRRFVQDHFQELRNLDQAARLCGVKTAYLCRLFQRFDEQTPYKLLISLRMNSAAGLLQQPGALVKNVAADLGYHNPFHFSKVFKSVFGITPEAFRALR